MFNHSHTLWASEQSHCKYRMSIHSFPVYKQMITWTLQTLRCTSVRCVLSVDNFPTRWRNSTLGVHMFVGFWMRHFQAGGLGEMVRHPGHHDHRISLHVTSFYGGILNFWNRNYFFLILAHPVYKI